MSANVDLYNNVYGDFASDAEAGVRRETYGTDIGQSSWMTAEAWLEYADRVQAVPGKHKLEVCSSSGMQSVYLAEHRGCRVADADSNENIVEKARLLVDARSL